VHARERQHAVSQLPARLLTLHPAPLPA
jgi:hypothetical protein